MKQKELAKQLGISPSYLSMILKGRRKPNPSLALSLNSLGLLGTKAIGVSSKQRVVGSNPTRDAIDLASNRSQDPAECSQTFTNSILDDFLHSRSAGTSAKTTREYHYTLDKFIGCELSPKGITSFIARLSCGNGRLNHYKCLKTLCNWLYRNDYISNNPIERVTPPKRAKRLLKAVSEQEMLLLVDHAPCVRDQCVIRLLFDSGMRVSEIASVHANDFDWQHGTVTVIGKGNKQRKAVFPDKTSQMLRAWFAVHSTFEVSSSGIGTMLKRLGREVGIKCNPHSFRRGFAVHQVQRGLSTRVVQALGGWESISMVEKYSRSLDFDSAFKLYHGVVN